MLVTKFLILVHQILNLYHMNQILSSDSLLLEKLTNLIVLVMSRVDWFFLAHANFFRVLVTKREVAILCFKKNTLVRR